MQIESQLIFSQHWYDLYCQFSNTYICMFKWVYTITMTFIRQNNNPGKFSGLVRPDGPRRCNKYGPGDMCIYSGAIKGKLGGVKIFWNSYKCMHKWHHIFNQFSLSPLSHRRQNDIFFSLLPLSDHFEQFWKTCLILDPLEWLMYEIHVTPEPYFAPPSGICDRYVIYIYILNIYIYVYYTWHEMEKMIAWTGQHLKF